MRNFSRSDTWLYPILLRPFGKAWLLDLPKYWRHGVVPKLVMPRSVIMFDMNRD
uniref:Uncharacterized protein n=1 Tax=Anguilla anguilla TaxID=7936 RepID=A0A0E9VAP5_ANGAN